MSSADRAELTEKFLDACIENGVDFPVVISVLGAGQCPLSPQPCHVQWQPPLPPFPRCAHYSWLTPCCCCCVRADVRATSFQRQMADLEDLCAAKRGTPVKRQILDTGSQTLQPVVLRCGLFYQNMFGMLPGIEDGTLYYPLGDGELSHVDVDDIGKCAAHILVAPEPHGGKTYNIIGERQAGRQIVRGLAAAARALALPGRGGAGPASSR